jgi:deoxyribonuclease V
LSIANFKLQIEQLMTAAFLQHNLILPDMEKDLRDLIAQIPPGRVATCGELAKALGHSAAARWVGHFALHHEGEKNCACHRIVRAEGELGGYAHGGLLVKKRLLRAEGIALRQGRVDLEACGFEDFRSSRPLEGLLRIQEELPRRIKLRAWRKMPHWAGGVDVAYPNAREGQAAYALVEAETGRLEWSKVIRLPVRFPYITSFLSFRELPLLLALIDEVRREGKLAEVVLVDGSGILHPRRSGIAAHFGVAADLPTVGVTKKLLCGQVDLNDLQPGEVRPVTHNEELLGLAIRATAGSRRPLFISPGHQTDLLFCEKLVRQLLRGRRLPEPIYWADRLSRR